jgi:hypothetical protein
MVGLKIMLEMTPSFPVCIYFSIVLFPFNLSRILMSMHGKFRCRKKSEKVTSSSLQAWTLGDLRYLDKYLSNTCFGACTEVYLGRWRSSSPRLKNFNPCILQISMFSPPFSALLLAEISCVYTHSKPLKANSDLFSPVEPHRISRS